MKGKQSKHIMMLGAGVMQLPAIRIARELGWRITVCDGNDQALGKNLGDSFLHIDLKDTDSLLSAAEQLQDKGLDGVFTAGTDFSASVAYVAEHLGLPGISHDTALRASDKALMREAFAAANVSQPNFKVFTDPSQAEDPSFFNTSDISLPAVVKPVDNMGSRGIRKIDDPDELFNAVEKAFSLSRSGRVILESFIPGGEYSLDALVWNGEIRICGFADRHIFFEPFFIEMGHTIPTALDPAVQEKIISCFKEGIRAIGIDNGVAKGDMKYNHQGPFVGEIAARLSGGYMSGWTYPYSSGFLLTQAAMMIAVGEDPGDVSERFQWVSAERAYISIPGIVGEISGIETARTTPCIKNVFERVQAGDTVQFPRNNVEKCGNIISQASDRESAESWAGKAVSEIAVRLLPSEEETRFFLCRRNCSWVPDAFVLDSEENRKALESMVPAEYFSARSGGITPLSEASFSEISLEAVSQENIPIYINMLPDPAGESSTDWHGRSMEETLSMVRRLTGIDPRDSSYLPEDGAVLVLGSVFWKCVLRGGYQGAVYLIDSFRNDGFPWLISMMKDLSLAC